MELEEKDHLDQERMSQAGPARLMAPGLVPDQWLLSLGVTKLWWCEERQCRVSIHGVGDRTHRQQRPHARTLLRAVNDILAIKLKLMQR